MPPLTIPHHKLLEPYLPNKSFPQSIIAWYYFDAVKISAKEACEYLLGDIEPLMVWAYNGRDVRNCMYWLERQRLYDPINHLVRPRCLVHRPRWEQAAEMALIRHPERAESEQAGYRSGRI